MLRISSLAFIVALISAVTVTPVAAQQEAIVSSQEIDAALTDQARAAMHHRAAVREFLATPAVTHTMQRIGMDANRLRASVALLDDAEAKDVADRLQTVPEDLAGGDVLVISSTTIIIALLVLLVILVAD